jgi:hypothetical protein
MMLTNQLTRTPQSQCGQLTVFTKEAQLTEAVRLRMPLEVSSAVEMHPEGCGRV